MTARAGKSTVPADVRERAGQVLAIAKGHLERDGQATPVAILRLPDGTEEIAVVGFRSHEEKQRIFEGLHILAKRRGAVAIILIQDVRFVEHADPEQVPRRFKEGEIADHPEQPEALIVVAMMADGASTMWMQRYTRQGAEIVWGELTEMGKAQIFLLKPWRTRKGGGR